MCEFTTAPLKPSFTVLCSSFTALPGSRGAIAASAEYWRKATGGSGSQADVGQVLVSAKKRSLDYTVSTETRKKESARSTGPTSPAQTSSP